MWCLNEMPIIGLRSFNTQSPVGDCSERIRRHALAGGNISLRLGSEISETGAISNEPLLPLALAAPAVTPLLSHHRLTP